MSLILYRNTNSLKIFQNSLTVALRLAQNRFLVHLRYKQNFIRVKDKSDQKQYLDSGIYNDPANGGILYLYTGGYSQPQWVKIAEVGTFDWIPIAIGLRKRSRNIGLTKLSDSDIGLPLVRQLSDWLKSMGPKMDFLCSFFLLHEFFAGLTSFSRISAKNAVSGISGICPCRTLLVSLLLLTPTDSGGLAAVDYTNTVIPDVQ